LTTHFKEKAMTLESTDTTPAQGVNPAPLPVLQSEAASEFKAASGSQSTANATPAVTRDHGGQHLHPPEERASMKRTDIPGWGADLDHANRPAYPMERMPPRLDNVHWTQPEDQPLNMTVFHSTERPGVTPLFGTSAPPTGLSGKLRGAAYRLSENDIRHWLLLLLADRVNMVEGIGEDLLQGRVPNLLAEMGIASEWKYNRAGLVRKAAIATAVTGIGYLLLRRRRQP
jgi:hypothetical protein